MSSVGVPSSFGFRLRPLVLGRLRGLPVADLSSSPPLELLLFTGIGEGDNPVGGLGPDNFKVIFNGEVIMK